MHTSTKECLLWGDFGIPVIYYSFKYLYDTSQLSDINTWPWNHVNIQPYQSMFIIYMYT